MLNNSKIYRSGCIPRVIFYSQTSKGHEYNYGQPIVSITGRNSRHITQHSSAERKLFSNIKPHPLPNSRRTINPNFDNSQIQQINTAKKYKWKNSTLNNTLCQSEFQKIKPMIKISGKKNKTSEELTQDINNKNKKNNGDKDNINKSSYSFYIKNKYDYNSEILNLPGGSKRKITEVKDDLNNKDLNEKMSLNSTANCFRTRDFNNSKISCLKSFIKNNNQSIRNKIINLTNNDFPSHNFYTNENLVKQKNDIKNDYNKEFNDDNKYKYNRQKNIRKNFFEASKENNENIINKDKFNKSGLFKNYIQDSFKYKNNDLITHYSRKRNMKSFNKVFNEVHEENSKYNLMKYYGNNYSKKNYSQFELN